MDWSAFVATAIGAVIALTGTVLADYLRGGRDRRHTDDQLRRSAYVDYLITLSTAHGRLRSLARSGASPAELDRLARESVGEVGVYASRERLLLSAAPQVIGASEVALRRLKDVRNAIASGAGLDSAAYRAARTAFSAAVWDVRTAYRADLGATIYPFPVRDEPDEHQPG